MPNAGFCLREQKNTGMYGVRLTEVSSQFQYGNNGGSEENEYKLIDNSESGMLIRCDG